MRSCVVQSQRLPVVLTVLDRDAKTGQVLLQRSDRAGCSLSGDLSSKIVPVDVCSHASILQDRQEDLAVGLSCKSLATQSGRCVLEVCCLTVPGDSYFGSHWI